MSTNETQKAAASPISRGRNLRISFFTQAVPVIVAFIAIQAAWPAGDRWITRNFWFSVLLAVALVMTVNWVIPWNAGGMREDREGGNGSLVA